MTASRSGSEPDARRRIRAAGLAGALAAALVLLLAGDSPQRALFDAWQRLAPRDLSHADVHVVAIDDESLREVGPWPWPRYHLARLTEEIGARGASAIGFDMIFAERDALSPDLFAGMYADALGAADRARLAALPSWDGVFSTVIGAHPVVLGRIGVSAEGVPPATLATEAVVDGKLPPGALAFPFASANIAELDDAARGYGLMNGPPDDDGVVRGVPLLARLGDQVAPSLGLELVRVAAGEERISIADDEVVVGARRAPIDRKARLLLHFGDLPPRAVTSAVNLLREGGGGESLAGKVVLVGLTASGTPDIVSTPRTSETYGVFVQAQAVNAILRGSGWLARPRWAPGLEWGVALLLGLAALLFLPGGRRAWIGVPATAVALTAMCWFLFRHGAVLIDPLPALVAGGGAALGLGLGLFGEARRERERLRDALVEERVAAAATEAELAAARSIQLGMLPRRETLAGIDPRLELDALLEPARSVGGDFYDVVRLSPDRIAFTVADVTGKGVPASLFMAVSKALSKSVVLRAPSLAQVAESLNEELSRDNADSGVTMLLGIIDLGTGTVELLNAGHENPILVRGDGGVAEVELVGGPPFCIVDYPWPVETIRLHAGDTLVLLTDGVTEAQNKNGSFYGRIGAQTALAEGAGSATKLVDRLQRAVRRFEDGGEASDDLTIMALRYTG
jgi:adenylate cyclase